MHKIVPLTELKDNEYGRVVDVIGGHGLVRNLEAMGIFPGVKIKATSRQFKAGPIVISIGNTQIAIGYGMARKILVEPIKEG